MTADFRPCNWDAQTVDDCRQIIRLAVREDLDRGVDLTTVALVPRETRGEAVLVIRQAGTVAGLAVGPLLIEEMRLDATWEPRLADGDSVSGRTVAAVWRGAARDLLTAERILLNLVGRLSGIATLTRRYVDAIAGTGAGLYDTRKTTPGWRRLEKYAVHCGGGRNHRTGLFDAVLIKDNHLAQAAKLASNPLTPAGAVLRAREFLEQYHPAGDSGGAIIEVEVDTLEQFHEVLPTRPDIILLDNMPPDDLRTAVAARNTAGSPTELEASGGITLANIRDVALTGVNRISVGALTHSAISLDVALDWA